MRCVLLFMALMTNVFMFAQSEICNLDTQYITLLQQKKYGEAETLLRENEEAFVAQYGDFDFAYGIILARVQKYINEDNDVLLDGISDEIKIVLSKYITDNASISHYLQDWGTYLYFCILSSCKYDTNIDLCLAASDVYANDCTNNNVEKYFYISKNIWEHYTNQYRWDEAIVIIDKVVAKASVCDSFSIIAECYYIKGTIEKINNNLDAAVSYWEKAIENFNKCDNAKEFVDYANAIYLYASYFQNRGNYSKAIGYSKNLPEICKDIYGYNSTEYVKALFLLAIDQYHLQEVDMTIKTIQTAKNICDSTSSVDPSVKKDVMLSYRYISHQMSLEIDTSAFNQDIELNDSIIEEKKVEGMACRLKGEYSKAIEIYEPIFSYYFNRGVTIQNCQSFLWVVCGLASCYTAIGKFDMADNCIHKCFRMIEDKQIHNNEVRHLYAALGYNYYHMCDYKDALTNMYIAKRMFENANDKYGVEYANLLGNMAMLFAIEEDFFKALLYNEEAMSLLKNSMITNIKEYSMIVNNFAVIYSKTNNLDKAISLLQELVRTTKEKKLYEEYGLALGNLGDIYLLSENYASAILCLKEALSLVKIESARNILWSELIYALCLSNSPEYELHVSHFNKEIRTQIANVIGTFSEREWDDFWNEKSQALVRLNNLGLINSDYEGCIRAYENALYIKHLTLNASDLFNRIVGTSNNHEIVNSYKRLKMYQNMLVDRTTHRDSLNKLRRNIVDEQKYIVRNTNISESLGKNILRYSDIEESLAYNECVVEFVSRPELISLKKQDGDLRYGVLIFRKGMKAPKYIDLCTEDSLNIVMDSIGQGVYNKNNSKLFDMLWRPFVSYLKKGDILYYSMCGDLGKINHSAISNGKQRIGDIYNMRLLSSTGIIPKIKSSKEEFSTAVVYGGINYEEPINEMIAEAKKYNKKTDPEHLLAVRGDYMRDGWLSLPGTLKEAETISSLLEDKGINVCLLKNNIANEESFKNLSGNSPDILHIATHGFYIEDIDESKNEYIKSAVGNTLKDVIMQRSGLLFSGANNSWKGNYPPDAEDGILTSEELARLDLSNTKLAILSACKTGLGETGYVDGVFGLQRALKKAGVETIVMSLWSVNDEVTAELMQYFYNFLLCGESKHKAFKHATKLLQEEYPEARYWAAFVMLD